MAENGNNAQNDRDSNHKCYVRFINMTNRRVDIMWEKFTSQYIRYRTLEENNYINIITYKTHSWIAKDFWTKDILHIDGKFLYQPTTTREFIRERYPDRHRPELHKVRVRAYITLPLYSLRYASLLTLRNYILKEETVDQLCLPKDLSDDLKKLITNLNREHALEVQYSSRLLGP